MRKSANPSPSFVSFVLPKLSKESRGVVALLASGFISLLGTNISSFALLWWVLEKTGSPLKMGFLTLFSVGTFVLFGPPVGKLIDRTPSKKSLLILTDVLNGVVVTVIGLLVLREYALFKVFYALTVLRTLFQIPAAPCRRVILKALIEDEKIGRMSSLSILCQRLPMFLGPMIGGFMIARYNVWITLFVNAATFMISGGLRLLIPKVHSSISCQADSKGEKRLVGESWKAVVQYLYSRRGLFWCIVIVSGIQLLTGGFANVLIVFIQQVLHKGADTFGLAISIISGVLLLVTTILSGWTTSRGRIFLFLGFSTMVMGLGFIVLGLTQMLLILFFVSVCVGVADAFLNVTLETMMLEQISSEWMGRVSVVTELMKKTLAPLSVASVSILMESVSSAHLLVIIGAGVMALGPFYLFVPRLEREIRDE